MSPLPLRMEAKSRRRRRPQSPETTLLLRPCLKTDWNRIVTTSENFVDDLGWICSDRIGLSKLSTMQ